MSENIKTIENAFRIIDLLHEEGSLGVSDIAKKLGLPKTSSHRTLKTLQNLDIVRQDKQEIYSLGYRMYKYARALDTDELLIDLAKEEMIDFAKETGETINLGVLIGDELMIIHSEEGEFYSLQAILSQSSPLNCSGMGKIFLSEFTDEELKRYFSQDFEKRTINTITTLEQYLKEKPAIVERNLAYDHEEYEYGLSCISTGLYNGKNEVIAALSISGPSSRLEHKGLEQLEKALLETSQRISKKIQTVE